MNYVWLIRAIVVAALVIGALEGQGVIDPPLHSGWPSVAVVILSGCVQLWLLLRARRR